MDIEGAPEELDEVKEEVTAEQSFDLEGFAPLEVKEFKITPPSLPTTTKKKKKKEEGGIMGIINFLLKNGNISS